MCSRRCADRSNFDQWKLFSKLWCLICQLKRVQTPALIISRVSRDWPFGHLAITHSPCSCVGLIILCFPQRDRAMVRLLFWTLFGVSLGLPQMPLEKLWRSTWEDVNGYHHISSMVIRCLWSSMGHNGLKRYIIRDQPFAAITRGTGKGPKHLEVHDDLTDVSDPRTHVFPKAFARHHLRGGLSNRVWLSLCVISSFPSSCPIRCFTAAKECQHKQLYYECLIAEGLPPWLVLQCHRQGFDEIDATRLWTWLLS